MRTIIDIPDDQVAILDRLAAAAGKSRAALIRDALQALIEDKRRAQQPSDFFGLWGPSDEEGLAHQERLRSEWPT